MMWNPASTIAPTLTCPKVSESGWIVGVLAEQQETIVAMVAATASIMYDIIDLHANGSGFEGS